jgi:hypothetical protein
MGLIIFAELSQQEAKDQKHTLGAVHMKQRDQVIYKDFLIWAITYSLRDSGEWIVEVNIRRKHGLTIRPFLLGHIFKTAEDATYHAMLYGELTIDGLIPGYHIEDI